MKSLRLLLLFVLVFKLTISQGQEQIIDVQGHRGFRGLYPENSIPGFLRAIDIGARTLEMDVVITKDNKVILSHEPWISGEICLQEGGLSISKASEKNYNLYQMDYEDIKQFDCGLKPNSNFPAQQKIATYKPLLSTVIDSVERYVKRKGLMKQMVYNIEIKSSPAGDNIYHPEPAEYVQLVVEVLKHKGVWDNTILQSFDIRPLKIAKEKYKNNFISLLVDNTKTPDQNITSLGFRPYMYSPNYKLVTPQLIKLAHDRKIKVIPWTVNDPDEISNLLKMGVDGIISDYPNRVIDVTDPKNKKKKKKA